MMNGRMGVVVAARTGSSRLPGKALMPLAGIPMVAFLLRRLAPARRADALILATTDLPADDCLADLAAAEGIAVYRGSSPDVVARYVGAAEAFQLDWVARVTADCPFVDARLLDTCFAACDDGEAFDLASTKTRFPVGIDVEIYSAARMAEAYRSGQMDAADREHLTKYFYDRPDRFALRLIEPPPEWRPRGPQSYTVDTQADYQAAVALLARAGGAWDTSLTDLLAADAR